MATSYSSRFYPSHHLASASLLSLSLSSFLLSAHLVTALQPQSFPSSLPSDATDRDDTAAATQAAVVASATNPDTKPYHVYRAPDGSLVEELEDDMGRDGANAAAAKEAAEQQQLEQGAQLDAIYEEEQVAVRTLSTHIARKLLREISSGQPAVGSSSSRSGRRRAARSLEM